MSRRLRYQVAVSLDGFIAEPNGEYDWIVMDPSIDFGALFNEFDTAVVRVRADYCSATSTTRVDCCLPSRFFPQTTARIDRKIKRAPYQSRGVDYWIVELDSRAVEYWRPAAEIPETVRGELRWSPSARGSPFFSTFPASSQTSAIGS